MKCLILLTVFCALFVLQIHAAGLCSANDDIQQLNDGITTNVEESLFDVKNDDDDDNDYNDEVNDPVVIDGDLLLPKEQASIYYSKGWEGLVNSQAWSRTKRRWSRTIPYLISRRLRYDTTKKGRQLLRNIIDTINEINSKKCIKFRYARITDKIYIKFRKSKYGCFTFMGAPKKGKRSVFVNYDCAGRPEFKRMVGRLLMRTMGRFQEELRPDRDTYVTINRNRCPKRMKKLDFMDAYVYGIPYDYYSVMHSSVQLCSFNSKYPSMTIKRKGIDVSQIGQRKKMTDRDFQHIKKAFGCK